MKTPPSPRCPFHVDANADADPPSPHPLHPPGAWPPGPPAGLTGWGLLRRMSRDPIGMLAEWQQTHGDVVHLRIRPEHAVVVTDPQYVRELLVTRHESLIRWERAMQVFAQIHGQSVLVAEVDA